MIADHTDALTHFGFTVLRRAATRQFTVLEDVLTRMRDETAAPLRDDDRLTKFHAVEFDERMTCYREFTALPTLLVHTGATTLVASDINLLRGPSFWHSDGFYDTGPFLRAVVYGEQLDEHTGALRVVPCSHRRDLGWTADDVEQLLRHEDTVGLTGEQVPAHVIRCDPGDVVVFNTNILHSSWGGQDRRQWAWNFAPTPRTPQERADSARYLLNRYVNATVRFS
jgi:hypothetical protein